MEDMTLCSPEHQEVFQRVWSRVMEGRSQEFSPVVSNLPVAADHLEGDLSCCQLAALVRAKAEPEPSHDRPSGDLPSAGEEPLHGGECTARLRQQVLEALEGWQHYRHLARRTRGGAARTLSALAADQHRQARRLSAAYFLLSGLRYWPTESLPAPMIPSFWGALRQRHQAEQQSELSYRLAADDTDDSTLLELYDQLAEGCRNHCRQLRNLLEQNCL